MKNKHLAEMSFNEVQDYVKSSNIIIIPFGSVEQHGYHLPLGVDTYIPLWLAEEISKKTGVVIAPPLWFAPCEWHMGFHGTISLQPRTMMSVTFDICDSLYRHGFRNFIGINGHTSGNNPSLLCAADEIQIAHKDAKLWIVDTVLMAKDVTIEVCEADILYHADEVEASQMLVARKDLVHIEKGRNITPKIDSDVVRLDYRASKNEILFRLTADRWKKLTEDGNIGDPTIATEGKGYKMMNALVNNVCVFIEEIKNGTAI